MAAIRPEEGTNRRNSHPNQVIAVCGRTGEPTNADDYQYIAGMDVSTAENLPNGTVVRVVPAQRYAAFTHRGPHDTLPDTFKYIYEVWLPLLGQGMITSVHATPRACIAFTCHRFTAPGLG